MTTLNDLTKKAEELLELEKLMDKVQAELKEVKINIQGEVRKIYPVCLVN